MPPPPLLEVVVEDVCETDAEEKAVVLELDDVVVELVVVTEVVWLVLLELVTDVVDETVLVVVRAAGDQVKVVVENITEP